MEYIFAGSNITTLIWMSQKVVCWQAEYSAVPVVFLVFIGKHMGLNTNHATFKRNQMHYQAGVHENNSQHTVNKKSQKLDLITGVSIIGKSLKLIGKLDQFHHNLINPSQMKATVQAFSIVLQ